MQAADGTIWIAQREAPPQRSADGEHFESVIVPDESYGNGRLLAHSDGSVYYTGLRGLSRFDDGTWTTWTVADGLAAPEPYYLCEGPDGDVWFGYHSSMGVTRFDGESFRTYSVEDGLTNPAVYSLGVDLEGDLWIGTARGVDRFDGERFVNYGKPEGYGSAESNAGGFWCDDDGTLWFGTAEGLTRYRPDLDVERTRPPTVHLEEVTLGGERVADGASVDADRRDLAVRMACTSYDPRRRIDMRYRLRGYSDDWHRSQKPRSTCATSLRATTGSRSRPDATAVRGRRPNRWRGRSRLRSGSARGSSWSSPFCCSRPLVACTSYASSR